MDKIIYSIINQFGIVALFVVFWLITHTFFHELGHGIAIRLFSKDRVILVIGSCSNTIKGNYYFKIQLYKVIIYISKIKLKDMHLGRALSSSNYQDFTSNQIRIIALAGFIGQSLYIFLILIIIYLFDVKDNMWPTFIICLFMSIFSWFFSPDRKNFFEPIKFKQNYLSLCKINSTYDYNKFIK